MSDATEAEGSVTAILKRADPLWWWLRENFKLPSLVAIAALVAGAAGWIWLQSHRLDQLADLQKSTAAVTDELKSVGESLKALSVQLEDQGDRLDRLERNWDDAGRVAAEIRVRPRRPAGPR